MTRLPLNDDPGFGNVRLNDLIPTVHHWPQSERDPIDDSLPRHAFDFRQGVQLSIWRRLDDLLERLILRPLGKLLLWILDSRSR